MTTTVPPGYQQTEVGVIPEDWEVCPVDSMGDVRAGKALAARGPGQHRPYLRTKNVFDGRIEIEDVLEMPMTDSEFSQYQLRYGDVLLNEGQSIELVGRCAMYRNDYPHPCAIQNQLVRFRAHDSTSAEFATHLFRRCQQTGIFSKIALQTTSVAHLGVSRFAKLRLAWPPTRTEQEAIAGALSDADALIESLEQFIAKKRQIKHGAMQELLTGSKRLPGFTGEWETHRFDKLFAVLRNASNSRSDLSEHGEVAYVHYGDIHTHPAAFLNPVELRTFIAGDKVRGVPRIADGDLLMADASEDTAAIGKAVEITGLSGREAVAGLHTTALRGNGALLADGFKGYIQFLPKVRAALVRLATGVSVYGITKSGVKAIEVAIPKPPEQTAIAVILADMEAEIAAYEAKLAKARQVKQGMMQELLTGRVRLV